MIDASSLDTFQQAVVASTATSIRVVAPAGSGKTETLSLRVQRRIAAGVDPSRILLLTFDNNARDAIVKRLARLGVPNGVRVSTLNAFGFHLLNTRFAELQAGTYRPDFADAYDPRYHYDFNLQVWDAAMPLPVSVTPEVLRSEQTQYSPEIYTIWVPLPNGYWASTTYNRANSVGFPSGFIYSLDLSAAFAAP